MRNNTMGTWRPRKGSDWLASLDHAETTEFIPAKYDDKSTIGMIWKHGSRWFWMSFKGSLPLTQRSAPDVFAKGNAPRGRSEAIQLVGYQAARQTLAGGRNVSTK